MIYHKLLMIDALELPPEICRKIKINYKYEVLTPTYKKNYKELMKHLEYYAWLTKKIQKKDMETKQSLIKTILEFDYY